MLDDGGQGATLAAFLAMFRGCKATLSGAGSGAGAIARSLSVEATPGDAGDIAEGREANPY